jgi:hypothetical protein
MTISAAPADIPFVTFACAKDVHYAKGLLGSIRHFYPANAIHIVLDDDVPRRDEAQMHCFPNAVVHRVSTLIDFHKINLRGLLAKLNVLFLPGVRKAVVADADSVLVGPVLDVIEQTAIFHALNGMDVDLTNAAQLEMFNRWAIDLGRLHATSGLRPPTRCPFVQGSHFFIDTERFPRDIMFELLPEMSYTHSPTTLLRAGDQGFWNYLVNFGASRGVSTAWGPLTIQVGNDQHIAAFDDPAFVSRAVVKDRYFIHYVGFSRRYLRRHHEYASALRWAAELYYEAIGYRAFVHDEIYRASQTIRRAVMVSIQHCGKNAGFAPQTV